MSNLPVLLSPGFFQRMTRLELSLAVDRLAIYLRAELSNGIFPEATAVFLRRALDALPYIHRSELEKAAAVDIFSQPVSGCPVATPGLKKWLRQLRTVAIACYEAREQEDCDPKRRILLALGVLSLLASVAPVLEAGYLLSRLRENGCDVSLLPEIFKSSAELAARATLRSL